MLILCVDDAVSLVVEGDLYLGMATTILLVPLCLFDPEVVVAFVPIAAEVC